MYSNEDVYIWKKKKLIEKHDQKIDEEEISWTTKITKTKNGTAQLMFVFIAIYDLNFQLKVQGIRALRKRII